MDTPLPSMAGTRRNITKMFLAITVTTKLDDSNVTSTVMLGK